LVAALPESEEKWNEPFGEFWTDGEQAGVPEAGEEGLAIASDDLGFGATGTW